MRMCVLVVTAGRQRGHEKCKFGGSHRGFLSVIEMSEQALEAEVVRREELSCPVDDKARVEVPAAEVLEDHQVALKAAVPCPADVRVLLPMMEVGDEEVLDSR